MKQWDFSDDEWLFFIVSLLASFVFLFAWYLPLGSRSRLRPWPIWIGLAFGFFPLVVVVFVAQAITKYGDPASIAGHFDYTLLFLAGAFLWLIIALNLTAILGIRPDLHALQLRNSAAANAVLAVLSAFIIIYAGGNMGAGPTIWTTIFPATCASILLFVLAFVQECITHLSDDITLDRDFATTLRFSGWIVACSLILARSIAGDWTSWHETFDDFFRLAWPALILTAASIALHLKLRPTPARLDQNSLLAGLLPALLFISLAAIYVFSLLPRPEIGKHIITYEQYMGTTTQ